MIIPKELQDTDYDHKPIGILVDACEEGRITKVQLAYAVAIVTNATNRITDSPSTPWFADKLKETGKSAETLKKETVIEVADEMAGDLEELVELPKDLCRQIQTAVAREYNSTSKRNKQRW